MRKGMLGAFIGVFTAALLMFGLMTSAAFADDDPAFSVYYTVNGGNKILAKSYTAEDLDKLMTTDTAGKGYLYASGSGDTQTKNVAGATKYAKIDDLLSDALGKQKGVYWNASSTMTVTCTDGDYTKGPWGNGGMPYATFTELDNNGKFFPATTQAATSVEGAVSVSVVLSMSYSDKLLSDYDNAGKAEEAAAAAASAQANGRIFLGQTESDFKEKGIDAGKRYPSGVVSITVNYTTPDFVVNWAKDGKIVGSKTYKAEDLNKLKQTGKKYGYIQYKENAFTGARAATECVTVSDLLADALGSNLATYWNENSLLSVTCSDGAYTKGPWGNGGMSYTTFNTLNKDGKFFPETTASTTSLTTAEDSPIILALSYASGKMKGDTSAGVARDEAAAKAAADVPSIFVGVTKEGMADPGTNAAGNRLPSGVTELTVNVRTKYEVKFDTGEGASKVDSQSGYAGDSITEPATPTREGYTFAGWFTDKECKTALDVSTYTIPEGGATIYAKWTVNPTNMFRLYNPNSGEHFYTAAQDEHDNLVSLGWNDEGTGWTAPATSNTPVYRLYNPYGGEHHYTMDASERDMLVNAGWNDEGVGWYSDDAKGQMLYREYNPNAFSCNHNYTTDKTEHDHLIEVGWNDEGTAWYGLAG